MKFIKIILFTSLLLNILGCGLYKPVDARKTSPKASDRAKKNIQEGRGYNYSVVIKKEVGFLSLLRLTQCGELPLNY